ncbi:MAG TPA: elongation factor G [Geobacteraceae bacterium]|nr:elongation factor G [Geobacteraceae bacterium]
MAHPDLHSIRNIGIISHIDAGKTTVSERILFYSGETHKMGEVHEGEAVMDWMPQEQERGITITATATCCRWKDIWINLIDTPGHIDFTIEVERSMRVLDGGVAIFSAVEGVQPQSESVWRQADRYGVPRICFINKMDRIGADHGDVLNQMRVKLKAEPLLLQIPMGSEGGFCGVIDLITEEALTFDDSDLGRTEERHPIPHEFREEAERAREALVEAAADFDDTILADYLAGKRVEGERLHRAIRTGATACRIFPVMLGAALRNKGIQPLMDAVATYLPSPLDIPPAKAHAPGSAEMVRLPCDPKGPLCALAFKVQSDEGRKLTFIRVYSGTLQAGAMVMNSTRYSQERLARLFRMHAHKRERIDEAMAGDIVAAAGLKDALTGDTLCDPARPLLLEGLNVPEPVVSLAVEPKGTDDKERMLPALDKLQWEDPTFRVHEDTETGQTLLTGMGELHLEIIVDRLAREFGVGVKTGRPQVVYRETISRTAERREIFQRVADGKAETGEVLLRLSPLSKGSGVHILLPAEGETNLPREWRAIVEESLSQTCAAGCMTGYPLTDLEVLVAEIPYIPGTTTLLGLRAAAQRGLVMTAREGGVILLEPIMSLEIITPSESAGRVLGSLQQKRGKVEGVQGHGESEAVRAFVPLAEMFGYMTELRSATKGRGTFTMEFSRFEAAPAEVMQRMGLA